jgi:hypothetical protein
LGAAHGPTKRYEIKNAANQRKKTLALTRVIGESDRAYNVTAIHPHVIAIIAIDGIWRWRLALTLASRPKWERKIEDEKKGKSRIPYDDETNAGARRRAVATGRQTAQYSMIDAYPYSK